MDNQVQNFNTSTMNLPMQAASVDREERMGEAMDAGIDPALFGLSWDDIKNGISTVAPYAMNAAKAFL